jgi:hypothetical protein
MRFLIKSELPTKAENLDIQRITLFIQFFIHKNPARQAEIVSCLKSNAENPQISAIYLLNETKEAYTNQQLGICSNKINQIPMGNRMTYKDVIYYVNLMKPKGWIVIANADIFFDISLSNLQNVSTNYPTVFSQLRYEYNPLQSGIFCSNGIAPPVNSIKLFGPRADSQDVWMYPSNFNDRLFRHQRAFNFQLGQAGCDNHISYLFQVLGFSISNMPELIKTYHYHTTQIREYKQTDAIKPPYCMIIPHGMSFTPSQTIRWDDNDIIREHVKQDKPFIIPRVAGIENNIAVWKTMENKFINVMKNNAGIKITNQASCNRYSRMYFKAFENCEMYAGWDKPGDGFSGKVYTTTHEYTEQVVAKNKQKIWARVFDIFNYVYSNPWTWGLRGKRILIISAFSDTIQKQISKGREIYPVDLFPECIFEFIKPPQTQGENPSREWSDEFDDFIDELNYMKDKYDVALVSAGGYGNIICNHIFEKHNKSAIYVGGVLQMYFGIYGQRWLTELPSIVKAYMNEHWVRVSENEKPKGYKNIENAAYF